MDLSAYCLNLAQNARSAGQELATVTRAAKDRWLTHVAELLRRHTDDILAANRKDEEVAAELGLTAANLDRLRLTPQRIQAAAEGLRQIAALPDPVGQVREGSIRPNGLQVQKISVPLGVIFFLYRIAPECHRGCRFALRKKRQRGHPARRERGVSLQYRSAATARRGTPGFRLAGICRAVGIYSRPALRLDTCSS